LHIYIYRHRIVYTYAYTRTHTLIHTQMQVKADKADVQSFSRKLSSLGDIFVFEAFGAAHRPHASIVGIECKQRVAGLLMKKELDYWAKVMGQPKKPVLAIIGGAKVSGTCVCMCVCVCV
jgi:3-phosphoglycerate kinase